MLMTSQDIDPQAVLGFIVRRQQTPETACAYLGTDPSEIRADLEGLDQHWLETVRISASADGRIHGAAVVEWDEELDRSWVHGPWVEEDALRTAGPELLAAVTAQAPVTAHEMYADVAHDGMAWLAQHCGWRAGEANFEYSRTSPPPAGPQASDARAATGADEPTLRELHEREFPGTYATTEQLLDPDGTYSTSVIDGERAPVGYVSWQLQGEAAVYIDFLAVHPGARRKGLGQRLIAAAQEASGRSTVALTVDEHRPDARAFYAALGFTVTAATRPYRLQRPA